MLGNVAEASGVPEISSTVITASATLASADQLRWASAIAGSTASASVSVPADFPVPFIGPQPASAQVQAPITELPRLRGVALLEQFALLSRPELSDALREHPELVASLISSPPAATDVASWWSRSSPESRRLLRSTAPELVGNLEGVPYATRDAANRKYVKKTIADIESQLDGGVGRAKREELKSTLHMLEQVREAIAPQAGEPTRQLVSIDTSGEGRAIIVVGNLDTADYVSYLIPGMFYGVDARIVPWTGIAGDIAAEQSDWLSRLDRADQTSAVVSWIGYHTPTLVNVASMENARQGRDALTASLQGLDAARATTHPYVSVLAHSYGATAALLALQENDVTVDALAMVGSAGSPARSVSDIKVRDGRVWVGAAAWDPIPDSGVFGSQPMSAKYGALVMGVDGGTDPVTKKKLSGTVSHNDYFDSGSEAMRNFALIGIDAGDQVMGVDGAAPALAAGASSRLLSEGR